MKNANEIENIQPIDFKTLIDREKDKKKVLYGLFDSILEANLQVIKETVGDNCAVAINYKKGGANILIIEDKRSLGERFCCIGYENVNPNKTLQELTREEIEDYLKRIVIGFIMEYDK